MMLSSVGARGDGQRCKELGIAAYLTKPVRQSVLLDAFQAALVGTPTQAPPEPPRQAPREQRLVTRHSLREDKRPLRVLLAEDNRVNQALIVNLLSRHGHQVVVAEDGREALDAHAKQHFDVILMDIQMPELDGFETTAAIRTREMVTGEHIHIVALTAHAMRGDRERCIAAGMDGYLTKPVKPNELYDAIDAVPLAMAAQ